MSVKGIYTEADLSKMAQILEENGFNSPSITVVINVKSKEVLSRINDDYFYRNNPEGNPPEVDEVNVEIGNIRFKYVVEQDGK